MSVADVEAKGILGGLSFTLAILDVEDAIRGHVLHRERRVRSDDPGTSNRVSWWIKRRIYIRVCSQFGAFKAVVYQADGLNSFFFFFKLHSEPVKITVDRNK